MKTAVLVVVAAALTAGLRAQAPKPEEVEKAAQSSQPSAIRVFTVRPGNFDRIWGAVRMIANEHSVSMDRDTNTLVVRAGQDVMPAIEQIVRQLDSAAAQSKNVELTFYILQGSREALPDAGPLPAELESTIGQLRSVFAFQGFRLLDTALIRGRDTREASVSGQLMMMKNQSTPAPVQYHLWLQPSIVADAKPPVIRIDRLRYSNNLPDAPPVGFDASVDIREGQKVVIGKTGMGGGQSALILIAIGRIVE